MLHVLAKHLAARLPLYVPGCAVEYGTLTRQGDATPVGSCFVHVQRDPGPPELITAAAARKQNPRQVRSRTMNGIAKVFARAEVDAALVYENESKGDALVDGLIVELCDWTIAFCHGQPTFTEARPLHPDELANPVMQAGFGYLLRFTIPRSVNALPRRTGVVHVVETELAEPELPE